MAGRIGEWLGTPSREAKFETHILLPNYCSNLTKAQTDLSVAIGKMKHTPCATEDEIKEVEDIYMSIEKFVEKLIKKELVDMNKEGE